MTTIWFSIYNILLVPALYLFFRAAAFFNRKIREGVEDRKQLFSKLEKDLAQLDRNKKLVWFHSASMGEFEQAKPIIEKLKFMYDINILITFFSPSGYRNSLKYKHKDVISYIPYDSPTLVKKFINIVNPALAIFMRYDFWPNILRELSENRIPVFLVDATMRVDNKRKWGLSKSFHKILFSYFTKILTVSDEDLKNFKVFDIPEKKLSSVGDTRFDRVYKKYENARNLKLIDEEIFRNKKVVVLGSSWPSDEEVILPSLKKLMCEDNELRVIIVPHEPTVDRLEKLEENMNGTLSHIRFSLMKNYNNEQVIIVDSIGILVSLYYYAAVAYVGGSFKQGIHNVLEASVYGIPVLFGPKITNSQEALKLTELGCGIVIPTTHSASEVFGKLIYDEPARKNLGQIAYNYVNQNIGATEEIIKEISKYLA